MEIKKKKMATIEREKKGEEKNSNLKFDYMFHPINFVAIGNF